MLWCGLVPSWSFCMWIQHDNQPFFKPHSLPSFCRQRAHQGNDVGWSPSKTFTSNDCFISAYVIYKLRCTFVLHHLLLSFYFSMEICFCTYSPEKVSVFRAIRASHVIPHQARGASSILSIKANGLFFTFDVSPLKRIACQPCCHVL